MCRRRWEKNDLREPDDHALGRSRGGLSSRIHLLCDGQGDPIAWPAALAGDKGYRADWIDEYLLDLEIRPVIPSKANEDCAARPVAFDKGAYHQRNIVERLIGWLKECRRVLTRFEKTAVNFVGMIRMAFIHRYLRLATK